MEYTIAALEAELPTPEVNELVTEVLASSLGSIGLFSNGVHRIADLPLDKQPPQYYERWLESTIRCLQERDVLAADLTFRRNINPLADLWEQWDRKIAAWASNPNRQAQAALLRACLEGLPDVLTGRRRATDVMFPNSSMHLVEGIYRGNPQADYFNDVLRKTLSAAIERQQQTEPECKIRIIEIGAGTGGTTAALLSIVQQYRVEEYCYTDISRAFLMYAEKQFRPRCRALTTSLFDVSRPLESQSIAGNHYDFAVAANVLHATANIRETVRNAKAVLRNHGILLLNEISTWSVFNHLTFGLLEGWWLYEDEAARLPGCPGLSPEKWREILAAEGFHSIEFPAEEAHRFGQQIILAVSNGWARQRLMKNVEAAHGKTSDTRRTQDTPPSSSSAALTEELAADHTRRIITEQLSEALRMEADKIRADASFADFGVDSIIGVNLVRTISEALHIELETTSLFEYSTVDDLTQYILKNWHDQIMALVSQRQSLQETSGSVADEMRAEVEPSSEQRFVATTRFAEVRTAVDFNEGAASGNAGTDPIAIIGMSGRFSESESLDAFWQHLAEGHDLVKEVSRWSPEECVMSDSAGGGHCSHGSFIDSIDRFDPAFFGISALEATCMDPQQRLFLEESWSALENAGYAGESVHEKQCGVYVGCGTSQYDRLSVADPPPQVFWGNSQAVIPARIAYWLNLQGPAIAIDTACSSSLVAIHLACQGLWSGETEMALAGGVFVQATPGFYQVANRAGMLSPDGKCYSFDARANGFVPGEGVGVVVLKRLRDALADGDSIHGLIAGSAINQDGRSNGLTAPNGRAQERLERSVYRRFHIDPATIQVVEAHATGTLLGDSVEYAALSRAFRDFTDKKQFCVLGTVKTNIGHASAAAGIAGVLKLLLSLRNRRIPPSLHFQKANPAIDFDSGPFYVNTELKDWNVEADSIRRAAVSSFGFGGTNAHLVIDEAPAAGPREDQAAAYLVVLSARSGEQLKEHVRNVLAHLERTPNLSITDLSFTLLMGRTHFGHRLACVARDRGELVRLLAQWAESGAAPHVYTAAVQEGKIRERTALKKFGSYCLQSCKDSSDAETYRENLAAIAELYVQGYALDFRSVFPAGARRIPLPTYPFARERYWLDGEEDVETRASVGIPTALQTRQDSDASQKLLQSDDSDDLCASVRNDLSTMVAALLDIAADNVSPDKVLLDLGLDSIGLTTFANAINDKYQLDITPVLFFDHPSIGEIAKYLAEERGSDLRRLDAGSASASRPAAERLPARPAARRAKLPGARPRSPRGGSSPEHRFDDEPVAIVGMSGVMPQSEDLDAFWANLENSRDLVTVIPEDRWRWEDYYGDPLKEVNKSNSKWGGFMKEIDKFDPLFFGISPREAQMMDPQQRIFLETACQAIEDSGQRLSGLSGTRTGVFVGVGSNDYGEVLRSLSIAMDGYTAAGNTSSVLANRVSFLLNLRGPSAPIDTACSSSLVAVHRAVEAIRGGDCDMAIAGGVLVMLSPAPYVAFGAAGMLSSDGQCKTFDKRANGYVRGEGAGAIFLKRLSAAEADGNPIYAVIKGTAENHGGRVTTLTAPNPSAQTALLIEAYEKAQIDPATVGYIECHGTGTSLGDPIEFQALKDAFAELYKRHHQGPAKQPHCALASVKSNIGHLETAAGIAGVLKVLLALEHKRIPASIHFEELNPYIKLEGTPFYIADKLTVWEPAIGEDGSPARRRAGVSSFGFGGSNAHVVLEEYIPSAPRQQDGTEKPQVIVISAKNRERLHAYVESMDAHLANTEVVLADFAYTLQVGRDEMPERLAFVASNLSEVRQKLRKFLEGREAPGDVYHNNVRRREIGSSSAHGAEEQTPVGNLVQQKELARLAELWTSGTNVDWDELHNGALRKRLSVPTYPFARERHWPSGAVTTTTEARRHSPIAAPILHPLIHRNVSTFEEQKFASRFSGDEFFFADHHVETQKMLPGVAYLEMARAAGELAANAKVRVIRNVTWQTPLIAGIDGREVEVSLAPDGKDVKFSVKSVGKEGAVHCMGKLSYTAANSADEVFDVAAIRERCIQQVISGTDLYGPVLSGSGLELGKSFHVAQRIYANATESLAVLKLPDHLKADAGQFSLHPALIDGSLHSCIGLVEDIGSGKPLKLTLPFSMGEVQIVRPLNDLYYGYATWAVDPAQNPQNNGKFNVHLLDERGTVLVRIKNFVLRPVERRATKASPRVSISQPSGAMDEKEVRAGLQSVVPVWNPVHFERSRRIVPPESTRILVVGSDPVHVDWVRKAYPDAQLLPLAPTSSADAIARALLDRTFDQLLWVAPDVTGDPARKRDVDERIIEQQEQGVLAVFRVIKALLQAGYAGKSLQWTIVTEGTQRVNSSDRIQPAHAGIVGLIGSLAKEYPRWDLKLLDVDSLASVSAQDCLSLPWDKEGNLLAHRQGEWFQQGLARIEAWPESKPLYRQGGVYVVIGGAGGVGEVWSRFMIERYQANIVWIGRRQRNSELDAKIDSLARLGGAPLYVSADATDLNALEQARQTILHTYPAIHGVVHSAIVLHDQSIARMDESVFRASLAAKVDVSVNMDRVFGSQELDFILFFSSMISFIKSAGQSNYSAGCTFKDSFAHKLRQERGYPVRTMNWGYWGSVGVVADEAHKKLMAQMGIASIEPEEGMEALQALVGSDVPQMALIKLNSGATGGLGLSETITHYTDGGPTILPQVRAALAERASVGSIAALQGETPTAEMTDLLTEILTSTLTLDKPPAPRYERWLTGTVRYLQHEGWLGEDCIPSREIRALADLWPIWDAKRSVWGTNPNLSARLALLDVCLRALPQILTGKQPATDVIFPNSSMHLVEAVYRGNAVADYLNEVLGETLIACLERLEAHGNRRIRIIEIGAGTGGTTAALLPFLQRFPIEEYCYTDVSKAFLMYGEKRFRPQLPVLTTAIFDVSKPPALQAINVDHYDVAIAANVLHATPRIRETLRNTKAVLKNQGLLLLNEISEWSLYSHLTFALLDGWWLYEDDAVRLPGCPGLAPAKWQQILAEEGFESTFFPAEEAHRFGQQIVAASSNGWVRQLVATKTAPQPASIAKRTASNTEPAERVNQDYVRQIIIETLADALKLDSAMIRDDDPFADYGVDSIIGVRLVNTINEKLQIELETTSLFEYTTVNQLAEYIRTHWQERIAVHVAEAPEISEKPASPTDRTPAKPETRFERFVNRSLLVPEESADSFRADRIAIIGMSGRFAESESLEEFWRNLEEGKDLVRKVSRWSATDCVIPGSAAVRYCSDGSFVDSIDRFDAAFFRISPEEALCMDPQQRIFLEESWRALEDAGYAGKSVREKQCGVYVGCMSSNYVSLLAADRPPQALWGNSDSVIPTRIAYYLDLQGPAIAVDTVCSSSLVAIHLASQGLWSGETDMALAGGIFLQATPAFYQLANRAAWLSPDGKCYSFDERASGFVPGEGVGVVVLKRLRDALADGDHIYGVIAGSGINQDGSSNGLIAPNARAQERLERSIYDRFGIDPATIQFVEAHGSGTLLGDSIEYGALSRAFRAHTDRKQFCAIGTVKTNIGHALTAGGIAGVLKVLLSLKHRQIPPSLHFQKGNPGIPFDSSPFYVNTQLREWTVDDHQVRRAAVSAFGANGTNAHLVIEEAPAVERAAVEAPGYVVALSARTREQLKQHADNLLAVLKSTPGLSMNDLSFTLFVGRMHLAHRLACVARNQEELIERLGQWLQAGAAAQVYVSEVQEERAREHAALARLANRCIQECRNAADVEYLENLSAIADLYVQGYSLDFAALFSEDSKRVPLPTYPFARERYWAESGVALRSTPAPSAWLHPLLHANTSTLGQQSFRCTLTGEEFFLRNRDGGGQKVLSEAAYLEMARAAIEKAACIPQGASAVELFDIVWADPMVVEKNSPLAIALFAGDDGHVDYEIYSGEGEHEITHCQGRASFSDEPPPAPLDVHALRRQMQQEPVSLTMSGAHSGATNQTVSALHRGDGQILAHLSLPATQAADRDNPFFLHPSLMDSALQVAGCLVTDRGNDGSTVLPAPAVARLRIFARCTEQMFVWARFAQNPPSQDERAELDIDLLDPNGKLCVQMRRLAFQTEAPVWQPAERLTWSFSKEPSSTAPGGDGRNASMGAAEKMAVFLRQETALQLQKAIEEIPTDQSFFDLGLTSLGMAHLVQNTGTLLEGDLSPSVLFEHSDIQSLAAYLANTYPTTIEAVTAVRQVEARASSGGQPGVHATQPTLLPLRRRVSGGLATTPRARTSAMTSGDDISIEQILERVSLQEASLDDGYEKVTF